MAKTISREERKQNEVGIHTMIVTTPSISISAGVLADSITIGNKIRNIEKLIIGLEKSSPEFCITEAKRAFSTIQKKDLVTQSDFDYIKEIIVSNNIISETDWDTKIISASFVEEEKIRNGLGTNNIRFPGFTESNATFVADGIYKFIKQVSEDPESLQKFMLEPPKRIFYGTESNEDNSKPEVEVALSMVFYALLAENEQKYRPIIEVLKRASVASVVFACVGGAVGLDSAVDTVKSSILEGNIKSALVIAADTAYYDPEIAPAAEETQGAAAVLMWITKDPKLAIIDNGNSSSFNISISDFTKFGRHTPYVYGSFSTFMYVYDVGKAFQELEKKSGGPIMINDLEYFVTHVPFPKQPIYFAAFLFAHHLKHNEPELYSEIQNREGVGKAPLGNYSSFIEMMDAKLRSFNINGEKLSEQDLVKYISKDKELATYWNWLQKSLRKQPEFNRFIGRLHIQDGLDYTAETGNSYAAAVFVNLAGALETLAANSYTDLSARKRGVMIGYGSGSHALALEFETVEALAENSEEHLHIDLRVKNSLSDTSQYRMLHSALIGGEASRFLPPFEPEAMDRLLLRKENCSEGFHIGGRNPDSTIRKAWRVNEHGEVLEILMRH